MNNQEFEQIIGLRCRKIRSVLAKKEKEYARGDRLHNFKRAGKMLQCTPQRACVSFWMKHVVSILDMVDDLDKGEPGIPEVWDEKIGDAINYLILLEGLVAER